MIDNLVILKGRLTAHPEIKTTPNGKSVCSFNIAVDRGFGENKATDFLTCVAWENRAEFVGKYFTKGSEIRILGEIQTRSYTDKNGNNRTVFEIRVNEVGFCGKKADLQTEQQADPLPAFNQQVNDAFTNVEDDDLPF